MLIIASAPVGRHVVGGRGELPLPAAARRMCGIVAGQPLLLAALTFQDLLVIHPAGTVVRLLADLHAEAIGVRNGG
jgi:bifunctional DNA-binding transcriptional regulator/antitoxin component of YhaV-PrlF toxin-antitoxin module